MADSYEHNFTIFVVLAQFLKSHMGIINTWRDFPAFPAPHPSTSAHVQTFPTNELPSLRHVPASVLDSQGVPSFGSSQRFGIYKDL